MKSVILLCLLLCSFNVSAENIYKQQIVYRVLSDKIASRPEYSELNEKDFSDCRDNYYYFQSKNEMILTFTDCLDKRLWFQGIISSRPEYSELGEYSLSSCRQYAATLKLQNDPFGEFELKNCLDKRLKIHQDQKYERIYNRISKHLFSTYILVMGLCFLFFVIFLYLNSIKKYDFLIGSTLGLIGSTFVSLIIAILWPFFLVFFITQRRNGISIKDVFFLSKNSEGINNENN